MRGLAEKHIVSALVLVLLDCPAAIRLRTGHLLSEVNGGPDEFINRLGSVHSFIPT